MSTRTVTVVVEITEHHTGTYDIDEADYIDWLDGAEDTPDMVGRYLKAGDDFEVISSICNSTETQVEIWDSVIDEVRA